VRAALGKTKNNSALGPHGISWKLLKALKGTKIGRAVIDDVTQVFIFCFYFFKESFFQHPVLKHQQTRGDSGRF